MPEAQAPVAERAPERAPERDRRPEPEARGAFDAVMDGAPEGDSGLVETPESAQKPRRSRSRRPRKAEGSGGEGEAGSPQEAAE
jgi:hypothetical protein